MHYFGGDNVHFTPLGYTKLVAGITGCFTKAQKNACSLAGPSIVSGGSSGRFYWRGFSSRHGAARPSFKHGTGNATRGTGRPRFVRNHPYGGKR